MKKELIDLINKSKALSKEKKQTYLKAIEFLSDSKVNELFALLKKEPGYERYDDLMALITQYESEQNNLQEWDIQKTTHVFFHSLIADTSKAFDGDDKEKGYDMYMTTISEFNKIMESMYKRGYVLVTPHQIARMEPNSKGKNIMTDQKIMLPKDKKAFILSIDDIFCL